MTETEIHTESTEVHEETGTPEISLPAEEVTNFGSFTLTNGMTSAILSSLIIISAAFYIRKKMGVEPSKRQVGFELLFGYFYDQLVAETGNEKIARILLPLITSLFLFILLANQFFLLPFLGAIITENHHHVFRVPTSDYSLTIGFALLVIFLAHFIPFFLAPLNHISHFIKYRALLKIKKISDIPMALVDLFLGVLEIVAEFSKIISLGTRLFGIIFSGEVIVIIISSLAFFTQFVIPIPFLALGVLAGTIHAFVFTTLAMLFISSNIRNALAHH